MPTAPPAPALGYLGAEPIPAEIVSAAADLGLSLGASETIDALRGAEVLVSSAPERNGDVLTGGAVADRWGFEVMFAGATGLALLGTLCAWRVLRLERYEDSLDALEFRPAAQADQAQRDMELVATDAQEHLLRYWLIDTLEGDSGQAVRLSTDKLRRPL